MTEEPAESLAPDDPADRERRCRAAGDAAMRLADRALEFDDSLGARSGYLAAAANYRKASESAAASGDEGGRRADEEAAVSALYAALPLQSGDCAPSPGRSCGPVRSSPA